MLLQTATQKELLFATEKLQKLSEEKALEQRRTQETQQSLEEARANSQLLANEVGRLKTELMDQKEKDNLLDAARAEIENLRNALTTQGDQLELLLVEIQQKREEGLQQSSIEVNE